MEKNSKSITVKRTVTIKAIVTEEFKKFLAYEQQQAIAGAQNRMTMIEQDSDSMLNNLQEQNAPESEINDFKMRLENERIQYNNAIASFDSRLEEIKSLKEGSLYIQGTIEGLVNIKAGDNLYKKLGGVEVIIKDGIVKEIRDTQNIA